MEPSQIKSLLKRAENSQGKRYWTHKLDRIFSEFVRLRDCHGLNGVGLCITCRKPITFKLADNSHYISRRHMALRWDEMNCNASCRYCNRFESGMQHDYYEALVKLYGADKVALMLTRKHGRGPDASEMKLLFQMYSEKVKALKEFKA